MDFLIEEENNFFLVYGIMVYKSLEQFEILFRVIYWLQNIYCVYVDKKMMSVVFKEFESIVYCFLNVVLVFMRIVVYWGYVSVLM